MKLPRRTASTIAFHLSKSPSPSPKPGSYQILPPLSRRKSAGIQLSGRSRTSPRATASARSIWPSFRSSAKNTGIAVFTVSMLILPCIARTACTPASASAGASGTSCPAATALWVDSCSDAGALAGGQHHEPRALDELADALGELVAADDLAFPSSACR